MSSRPTIGAARDGVIAGSENSTSHTAVAALRRRPVAPLRLVLLACGLIAFLLRLWTGMARLGVGLMGAAPLFVEFHGVLMICGFFGTLICVERAVALNRPLAYMIPIFAAAGTLALLARTITLAGAGLLDCELGACGSVVLEHAPAAISLARGNTLDRRVVLGIGYPDLAYGSSVTGSVRRQIN